MNENANFKNIEDSPNNDQDIAALLKKIKYQLDSMEKKIDSLTHQSRPKTFAGKPLSRPRQEYDKTKRQKEQKYEGRKEEVSSEGRFYHGRPFNKKKTSGASSFGRKRQPFSKSSKEKRVARPNK